MWKCLDKNVYLIKCVFVTDNLSFIFVTLIIQQMISKDDRLKMEVIHQTPKYCLSGILKAEDQLLLLLCAYCPAKTFEQVITLKKMPEAMKNAFGSVHKIHDLLRDPMSIQVDSEEGKIKIRVPVAKQKTKTSYKIVVLRLIQTRQDLYKVAKVISTLRDKIQGVRKNPNFSLEGKTTDELKVMNNEVKTNKNFQSEVTDQKSCENIKLIEKMMNEKIIGLKKELTESIMIETKRIEQQVKKEMKTMVQQIYEENEREWERMVSFLINNLAAMTDNSLRNQFFTRQNSVKSFQEDSMAAHSAINQKQNHQSGIQTGHLEKNKFKKSTRSEHGNKNQANSKQTKSKQIPHIPLKEKKSEIVSLIKRQKTDNIPLNSIDCSKDQNQFSSQYQPNYLYHSDVPADPSESLQDSKNEKRNPQTENLYSSKLNESQFDENDQLEYEEEFVDESEDYSSEPSGSEEEDFLQSLNGNKFKIKGIGGKGVKNNSKKSKNSSREVGEHMARKKEDSVKKSWKNSERSLSKYPSSEDA